MVASLLLAGAALRVGLSIRRARATRKPPPRDARAAHLRIAKPAIAMLVPGFLLGIASSVWLRGWEPFATFHGLVGFAAAVLFVATAFYGRRLERGDASARAAHAWLGLVAMAGAALAAFAGFVLLP